MALLHASEVKPRPRTVAKAAAHSPRFGSKHAGDSVLAEAPMPVARNAKISREELAERVGNRRTVVQEFVMALLDSPMTPAEAANALGTLDRVENTQRNINSWHRKHFGVNLIVKQALNGKAVTNDIWTIRLNPAVVDVDYSGYDITKHIRMQDILTPPALAVVKKLAALGFATTKQAVDAGISEDRIHRYLVDRSVSTNIQATARGFPPVILATSTEPETYFVNPEFAGIFGLEIAKMRDWKMLFTGNGLLLLSHLETHGDSNPTEMAVAFGKTLPIISDTLGTVNRRCKELGLPKAIRVKRIGLKRLYCLTKEFRKECGIKQTHKPVLEHVFPGNKATIIAHIAANPFSQASEIATALGIVLGHAVVLMKEIIEICERENLPKIVRIAKSKCRYALSKEFAEYFGLRVAEANPERVLGSKLQARIYRYFAEHPRRRTITEAARHFVMDERNMRTAVNRINEMLKQAGLEPLAPRHVNAGYRTLEELSEAIVQFRQEHGYWPISKSKINGHAPRLAHAAGKHGGLASVVKRTIKELEQDEMLVIVRHDFGIVDGWNFSKYIKTRTTRIKRTVLIRGEEVDRIQLKEKKGQGDVTVKKAFLAALVRGAEREALEQILRTVKRPEDAIQRANELADSRFNLMLPGGKGQSNLESIFLVPG